MASTVYQKIVCTFPEPLPPNAIIQLSDDKTDQVTIAWTATPSYDYEASYSGDPFEQVPSGTNTHTFTGLAPNMCQV